MAIGATMLAVLWFFHWTVKTSGGFGPPGEEDYYNFLVRGWRAGHLHLSKLPSPEMLALSDPYDPAQNSAVRLADASYFNGRYYLYFGAAPAVVLLAPYYFVTGRELGTTTAIFVFCSIGYLAQAGVWLAVRRRYFPASGAWLGVAGVAVLGLATPVLALLRRPLVWELPIAAGFTFAMLALAACWRALHGRRPLVALAAAGLALGLAVASRPTCLLGAGMLLPVLWVLHRRAAERVDWRRGAIAAGLPLGLMVAAVLAHNYARFGDALEFGQNFQLTGVYESKMRHFHWSYMPHNLAIYGWCAPQWGGEFPFVRALAVRGGPAGYLGDWNEGVAGLAVTSPVLWLAFALPLAWRGRGPEEARRLRAIVGAAGLNGAAMAAVMLAFFLATPRYAADFAPMLALLAMIGALGAERWMQGRVGRVIFCAVLLAACAVSVAVGAALSLDCHERLLQRMAPDEWSRLEKFFGGAK